MFRPKLKNDISFNITSIGYMWILKGGISDVNSGKKCVVNILVETVSNGDSLIYAVKVDTIPFELFRACTARLGFTIQKRIWNWEDGSEISPWWKKQYGGVCNLPGYLFFSRS